MRPSPSDCARTRLRLPLTQTESTAVQALRDMSDSTRRTLDYQAAPERDVIMAITDTAGAADGVDEMQVAQTVSAAAAGFDASLLKPETQLDTLPPLEQVLHFKSADGEQLVGREIVYKWTDGEWYRARLVKQATDGSVKSNGRVCNYRAFFDDDEEILNVPLYSATYAKGAEARNHGWMLVAMPRAAAEPLLQAPAQPLAALMPPAGQGGLP
mmetsp:Transcript_31058/g.98008  ORF Transcript_31058/g.98008 Transcript_31058/m.98008 type:complete len:213 (+) Transcript_31058:432-1070(+)